MRRIGVSGLALLVLWPALQAGDEKKTDKKANAKPTVQRIPAENLAIGKVAPDIVGEDIDGKKFKLSDYRGKVVVLDFWGHW